MGGQNIKILVFSRKMFFEADFWLGGSREYGEKDELIIFLYLFIYFSTFALQSLKSKAENSWNVSCCESYGLPCLKR